MITCSFSVQPMFPGVAKPGPITNIVGGFKDGLGRSFAVPVHLRKFEVSAKPGPDGKWIWQADEKTPVDINGLRACPSCGKVGQVKLQTPPDADEIVRRAYFRCFSCHSVSPNMPIPSPGVPGWTPVHWHETGAALWEPLRDFYNAWAEQSSEG